MKRRHFLAGVGTFGTTGCLRLSENSPESDSGATTDSTTTSRTTVPPASTTEEAETTTETTETTTDSEPADDMDRTCEENPIPQSVSTTWPQAFFDSANTGHQPEESVTRDKPCIAWKKEGQSRPLFSTVVTEDVVIKGGEDDHLQALDRVTGEVAWSTENTLVDTLSSVRWPQVADGTVYFSAYNNRTFDKRVYALDAATGEREWNTTLGDESAVKTGFTLANGSVYVAEVTDSPTIYALSQDDGSVTWQTAMTDAEERVGAVPFGVDDDLLCVPTGQGDSGSGGVHAFDAQSGEKRWFADLDSVESAPVVGEDRIYVTNDTDYTLRALDRDTGEQVWGFETLNGTDGSPAIADGAVYFGNGDGDVYRIDAASGQPQWKYSIETRVGNASPAVVGDTVLVGGDDVGGDPGLHAIDRTDGTLRWKFRTGTKVSSDPSVVGGVIYVSVGSYDTEKYTLALA